MRTILKIIFTSIVLIFFWSYALAQNNVGFKLNTFTYQFSDVQPELAKLKLSQNGQFAIEPGIIFSYEEFASSNTAIKISQSFILDKALHLAGASQIMIKFRIAKSFKHSVYMALGPVFHFRQTWASDDTYINEPIYNSSIGWQYKFSWISGEIEYNYYLNKYTDFSVSLNHIQAESIGLAFGLKRWINKNPKKKRGCVSCPGLH
jgi:hypothetical protein